MAKGACEEITESLRSRLAPEVIITLAIFSFAAFRVEIRFVDETGISEVKFRVKDNSTVTLDLNSSPLSMLCLFHICL